MPLPLLRSAGLLTTCDRAEWGCPDGRGSPRWPGEPQRPTHVVVHHTAIPVAAGHEADAVLAVWQLHAIERGWGDIGYHYLIGASGTIYEGRAGGPAVVGGHLIGANRGTIGIALLGNFMTEPVAVPAFDALVRVAAALCERCGIDPDAREAEVAPGWRLPAVCGHRDGNPSTECPGDGLYPRLDEVRRRARAVLHGRL